jgi:hypothetical protein
MKFKKGYLLLQKLDLDFGFKSFCYTKYFSFNLV